MGDNLEKEGGNNDEIFPKEYVDYLNQLLLYEARLEACADRKRRKQRKGKGKNQKKEKVKRKRKQSCEPYRN